MELYCIDCKKNIKKNSKEHDNCILINDGEDLVCEDCGYTDDEYEEYVNDTENDMIESSG